MDHLMDDGGGEAWVEARNETGSDVADHVRDLRDIDRNDLELAGGKGANLGALIRAGLPVPPGFCVTTGAYQTFVEGHRLAPRIGRALASADPSDPVTLEAAAASIRAAFTGHRFDGPIAAAVLAAYARLSTDAGVPEAPGVPVAVRSSATAEDLPDLSFAGQQDTYLDVAGGDALLAAVVHCWASLWTARAIGYRARNGVDHHGVRLAVVVQRLVPSEASGVLFTADPVTGCRDRTVIEATVGLGEALVSGQVEPDHHVVATGPGPERILSTVLGAKGVVVRDTGGGTVTGAGPGADVQALPDEQILAVTLLGRRAEELFGVPQDVEWCWAGGRLHVVQSRPITSLFPLADGVPREPATAWLSYGVWQGMLDPYTPVGQDAVRCLAGGAGARFGTPTDPRGQRVFVTAAERLFVNIGPLLHARLGRTTLGVFLQAIDPISRTLVEELEHDPRWAVRPYRRGARRRIARTVAPVARSVLRLQLRPRSGRARLAARIDAAVADARARCAVATDLTGTVQAVGGVLADLSRLVPTVAGAVAAGNMPYQVLLRAVTAPGGQDLVADLALGLPHNVTTRMTLDLWEAARQIRADAESLAGLRGCTTAGGARELADRYARGDLPGVATRAVAAFLDRYGARGPGEVDLGRARWRQDPAGLFQVLGIYLDMPEDASPRAVHESGAARAERARAALVRLHRTGPLGPVKAFAVRSATGRVRELAGLRETPKFCVVQVFGVLHEALVTAGARLVRDGVLDEPEDLLFLHLWEMADLAAGRGPVPGPVPGPEPGHDWRRLVRERRARYARELRRTAVPRILLGDGTALHGAPAGPSPEGPGDGSTCLVGSPVSPGSVTGRVRVVLDPLAADLRPGEIMVCPATDPAWTPLFLAAAGLVMEVGGMMTHGCVVAREYGLPAVAGLPGATRRLRTGDLVAVDGSRGTVTVLEPVATSSRVP